MTHRLLNGDNLLYVCGSWLFAAAAIKVVPLVSLFTITNLTGPLVATTLSATVVHLGSRNLPSVLHAGLPAQDLAWIDRFSDNVAWHSVPVGGLPADHVVLLDTLSMVWIWRSHCLLSDKRITVLGDYAIAVRLETIFLPLVTSHRHLKISVSRTLHRPT